jgi:hypothetical protein
MPFVSVCKEGIAPHACTLKAYPMRVEGGDVQVELG